MNRCFRPLVGSDLELVASIDSAATQIPWSLAQFVDSAKHNYCTVICLGEQVIGFAIFQQVLDEITLLNIAIQPNYQRQGHAKALLVDQLQQLSRQGARQCFLEVRLSNLNAIGLYQALGFIIVGERKNYYPVNHRSENGGYKKTSRENALVMCLSLEKYTEDSA